MRSKIVLAVIVASIISIPCYAAEWTGFAGIEYRHFLQDPADTVQHGNNFSLSIETEFYHEWDDGSQSLAFVPYARLDENDTERSHFDIRELTWLISADTWELRLGIRKEFWGVMEFQHLTDIINQTDLVENLDGEDKLGQPMINLALIRNWGTIDFFLMPYFRERNFPGTQGRLRTTPPVGEGQSRFESAARKKHQDFALRYSHFISDWDIGIAHFYGTSRDPRLLPDLDQTGKPLLIPFYEIINQTSLDLQATKGNMLWKLEAIHRSGQAEPYNAFAVGFEYTFVGIFETAIDLSVLGEYHYDDRGESAPTLFEDDIGTGIRLAFNDAQSSTVLMGLIVDRNTGGKFFNLEASRRFGDSWVLELQARILFNQSPTDPAFAFSRDDYIELFLSYNF